MTIMHRTPVMGIDWGIAAAGIAVVLQHEPPAAKGEIGVWTLVDSRTIETESGDDRSRRIKILTVEFGDILHEAGRNGWLVVAEEMGLVWGGVQKPGKGGRIKTGGWGTAAAAWSGVLRGVLTCSGLYAQVNGGEGMKFIAAQSWQARIGVGRAPSQFKSLDARRKWRKARVREILTPAIRNHGRLASQHEWDGAAVAIGGALRGL